jgi:hypothetical protein
MKEQSGKSFTMEFIVFAVIGQYRGYDKRDAGFSYMKEDICRPGNIKKVQQLVVIIIDRFIREPDIYRNSVVVKGACRLAGLDGIAAWCCISGRPCYHGHFNHFAVEKIE